MIYEIRGQRIMLDFHLAKIYGYETRSFNQQVKRNSHKFPNDFMLKLTREELNEIVISQNVISPNENYFLVKVEDKESCQMLSLNRDFDGFNKLVNKAEINEKEPYLAMPKEII